MSSHTDASERACREAFKRLMCTQPEDPEAAVAWGDFRQIWNEGRASRDAKVADLTAYRDHHEFTLAQLSELAGVEIKIVDDVLKAFTAAEERGRVEGLSLAWEADSTTKLRKQVKP